MTSPRSLEAVADWLVRHRLATLDGVWALTLPDLRRAARILGPQRGVAPPTRDDLAALMRAFPDTHPQQEMPDGR